MSDSAVSKPSFRKGADEAREATKGGQFARTNYFGIEDGHQVIVRFLTDYDSWIVVNQHSSIPTKAKPGDYPKDSSWPEKMGAVCRRDKAFSGMYDDCFICDHMVGHNNIKRAYARSWAYAVLREEVVEDGQVVGYRDQTREIVVTDKEGNATGETRLEKAIVVVNMGYKNFFAALEGFGKHYKTVLDRDYLIKRSGKETDTLYPIIPMDPIVGEDGVVFDLRLPQYQDRYKPEEDLETIVTERSSDEFYARFFDTRVAAPPSQQRGGSTASSASPAAEVERTSTEPDADRLAAMANRVKAMSQPTSEATSAAAPAAAKPATSRNFD